MKQCTAMMVSAMLCVAMTGSAWAAQADTRMLLTPRAEGQINYTQRELYASPAIKAKLQTLRQEIASKHLTFEVGYTTAMDQPLANLTGGRPPANIQAISKHAELLGQQALKLDNDAMQKLIISKNFDFPELHISCNANLPRWDYRTIGKVTPVKNQNPCGSCWDFAASGALESSYLIRNNSTTDVSEQQILSCAGVGTCGGGWYTGVFEYMISNGASRESDYPYTASDSVCSGPKPMPYRAVAYGVVHPESPIATVPQIKQALCQYGPLAIGVLVRGGFQAYTTGVLNDGAVPLTVVGNDGKTYYNVNHAVLLIGWDDSKQAWLIKNSWGHGWGSTCDYGTERGYIYIHYGDDNVGLLPGWVRAKQSSLLIDPNQIKKIYPTYKPIPPGQPQELQPVTPIRQMITPQQMRR